MKPLKREEVEKLCKQGAPKQLLAFSLEASFFKSVAE
jgi:hypothetical protein